ncbi:MAG: thermonuclease family protein [Alphaproteobacteria bacterium]|nr:thermonuclease family protein [Alphaproteobacteria bacterium]
MQHLKHIVTAAFLVVFCVTLFTTANLTNSQTEYFRVKSHLVFDKKFFGKVFVIDGDSLKVGGKEVRLFGVDAPEYSQTCFDAKKEEYACGHVSLEFTKKLAGGKIAECVYAEQDKYDRYLSKCRIDELSINEELVKNGMAVVYNFTESDEKMDALEAAAKQQKLGIWQGAFQLPKNYRKDHPRN